MSEKSDSIARKILNDIAGTVNGTSNQCMTRIIFGDGKEPQKSFKEGITMPEHGQKFNYVSFADLSQGCCSSTYPRSQEEEDDEKQDVTSGYTGMLPSDLAHEINRIDDEINHRFPLHSHEVKVFGEPKKATYFGVDKGFYEAKVMIKLYGTFSANRLSKISFDNTSFQERFNRITMLVTFVKTYNDRVVLVRFADGTFTKSVCAPNDTFDIDTGIMVCLIKKLLGDGGTKIYNDALRHVHKVMDRNEKIAKIAKECKSKRKAEKIRINAEKKAAKERKRQERIEEMAEAIKLANKKEESE